MLIIQMNGRMCNQIFHYALYLSLLSRGRQVRIDDSSCYPFLRKKFGIVYERSPYRISRILSHILTVSRRFPSTPFLRYISKKLFFIEMSPDYMPEVFTLESAYLCGYWQSEKYFDNDRVKEKLRKDFAPPQSVLASPAFKKYYSVIRSCPSVAVHIRRGDYFIPGNAEIYGGIATLSYFLRAEKYILERIPDARFFVFSDDIAWAKKNLPQKGHVFVSGNDCQDLEEFYLIRFCRHRILSHSSFSWWAAWLNDDENSLNIVPDKWMNGVEQQDIYTSKMTKLPHGSTG